MNDLKVQEWSSNRLRSFVKVSITKMFEGILDFSEVAVGDEKRHKSLRSKILRLANDAIRSINAEIETNYDVTFTGLNEDEVRIIPRKGEER